MSIGNEIKVICLEDGRKFKSARVGRLIKIYRSYIVVQFEHYREAFLIGDIMCKRVKCEVII